MSESLRTALWNRMTRKVNSPSCPPLLAEKWADAGKDKAKKNDIFDVYLATGGNVGKMTAIEQARFKISSIETDQYCWTPEDNYRRTSYI